ncbi:hypothetical protein RM533_12170 [Croceicoccus sp. F390]|uniref:Uncharacterized protein n=1 Tax=Croceicoccus esteveae TaxID=3075597 RepID=A0ABU2ZJY9_9SPHN|nr:hypothetical protein [Croceicoccus sp. F390]MDT0576924.1 hypothetical protein [Croceicoccus sp. F390]
MAETSRRHPQTVCSLAIIRDRNEFATRSAIRSTAIFTVTRCPESVARFSIDHRAFDRTATRAEILAGVAERIPAGATLIARASRFPQHYLRHSFNAGGPLPPADLHLLQRERPDLDILPLQCANSVLEEIAAAYRIERAGPGSNILSRSRRAPDEAQCLWAAFMWSQSSQHERTSLSAAWQAWRVIERARPVGF